MDLDFDDVREGVVDRFDELRDDMEGGFSKLRRSAEEMGADELRRDVQSLMMIGHSQMDTIRRQRREIEGMQQDLMRRHGERTRVVAASMDLLRAMGVPFDPEDDSPAKWLRMAATVAERAISEPRPVPTRSDWPERVLAVTMAVVAACVAAWTLMLVTIWL